MSCPVQKAIAEIKGSGIFDTDNTITIYGGETEYVCDEMVFYITRRKMEFARFELMRPDSKSCVAFYNSAFKHLKTIADYSDMYNYLIGIMKSEYVYNQFVGLINLIGELEQCIQKFVTRAARQKIPINISLPDIFLLPHVDMLVIYRTDILCNTINKIIDYINRINLNSMVKSKFVLIQHMKPFTNTPPDMKTLIPHAVSYDIDELRHILSHEMVVAEYTSSIERYQCQAINHMNELYTVMKKIIDDVTHV